MRIIFKKLKAILHIVHNSMDIAAFKRPYVIIDV